MNREDFIVENIVDYSYETQDCLKVTFDSDTQFNSQCCLITDWLNEKHYTYEVSNENYRIAVYFPIKHISVEVLADSLMTLAVLVERIDDTAKVSFEKTEIAYSNYFDGE